MPRSSTQARISSSDAHHWPNSLRFSVVGFMTRRAARSSTVSPQQGGGLTCRLRRPILEVRGSDLLREHVAHGRPGRRIRAAEHPRGCPHGGRAPPDVQLRCERLLTAAPRIRPLGRGTRLPHAAPHFASRYLNPDAARRP